MGFKSSWVKYRDMGGPRYLGEKKDRKWVHEYNPSRPWGVWSQILGVVARSEGRHDTVVMYDETGVTFGAFQWTFKAGRLQKLLEYFKSVPVIDFTYPMDQELSVFDRCCTYAEPIIPSGLSRSQIFEQFGFKIKNGIFYASYSALDKPLRPTNKKERNAIVSICMGRRNLEDSRKSALALCDLFVNLGQQDDVQLAMIEYAKLEFKRALDVRRKPLKDVGGTIRCLLLDEVWGTPIPAIFFNLYQNAPAGSFKLFKNAMKEAKKKGLVKGPYSHGYIMEEGAQVDDLLDLIWRRLNKTAYADWGFRSRQYLESGGKNPPRIKRIKPAIKEFYGIDLPYYK